MQGKIPYDHSYKLLFSEPRMVQDLLLGFFGEKWIEELDFTSLKRMNTEYVTENLRERESDIVWKVRWRDDWLYLLILIEFQSTVDTFMVVRTLSYVSLLYQDILKEDGLVNQFKELPPILPLVLYSGEKPWTAPLKLSDLMAYNLPKLLKKYQPEFMYWILDEGRCTIKEDVSSENVMLPLIALEQSREAKETKIVVDRLVELLKAPQFDSLRRAYTVYLQRVLKAKEVLPTTEINELYEVQQMLSQRVDVWIQRGIEEGIPQGISQGISQGELAVIKRQLTKRFGVLTREQIAILESKTEAELLEISEQLLDAHSLDEII